MNVDENPHVNENSMTERQGSYLKLLFSGIKLNKVFWVLFEGALAGSVTRCPYGGGKTLGCLVCAPSYLGMWFWLDGGPGSGCCSVCVALRVARCGPNMETARFPSFPFDLYLM